MGVFTRQLRRNFQFSYQTTRNLLVNKAAMWFSPNIRRLSDLPYTEDRYGGIHLRISDYPQSTASFAAALAESMVEWKKFRCPAVWIEVPINSSSVIPLIAEQGFVFHHAEGDTAVLYQWIDEQNISRVPRYATHQVGVSGCVVNEDTKQVLAIKDRNRKVTLWKFPGGLSELGEDIGEAAEREVYEETGVKSKFQGVLTFRQQHDFPTAYGRSDLYFLCHMTPSNLDLHPCPHEIEACQWMDIDEMAGKVKSTAITLRVLQLVKKGLKEGFDKVTFKPEEFKSIYRGRKYFMYNIPIGKLKEYEYAHDLTDDSIMKSGSGPNR